MTEERNITGERGQAPRAGFDRLNESERRYAPLPREDGMRSRHGEREREFQEKEAGVKDPSSSPPIRDVDHKSESMGTQTEGAFGAGDPRPVDEGVPTSRKVDEVLNRPPR